MLCDVKSDLTELVEANVVNMLRVIQYCFVTIDTMHRMVRINDA